jgi:hypothetical protein
MCARPGWNKISGALDATLSPYLRLLDGGGGGGGGGGLHTVRLPPGGGGGLHTGLDNVRYIGEVYGLVAQYLIHKSLCANQPVSRVHDNSSQTHSATTWACWPSRAVRELHHHAIELASRRWREVIIEDAPRQFDSCTDQSVDVRLPK